MPLTRRLGKDDEQERRKRNLLIIGGILVLLVVEARQVPSDHLGVVEVPVLAQFGRGDLFRVASVEEGVELVVRARADRQIPRLPRRRPRPLRRRLTDAARPKVFRPRRRSPMPMRTRGWPRRRR